MDSNPKKSLSETAQILALAIISLLIVRTFFVQPFRIPTGSMLNTLQLGDQLLVSKIHYGLINPVNGKVIIPISTPMRGDIIVFEYPFNPRLDGNRVNLRDEDFVKRILGIPGDTVEIRAKRVFVNDQPVHEPYVQFTQPNVAANPNQSLIDQTFDLSKYFDHCEESNPVCIIKRDWMPKIIVPPGKYFVLGDNRDESYDSRYWGFVDQTSIKGKAFMIYWSWNGPGQIRWERIGSSLR